MIKTIRYKNGNTLAYAEAGDINGSPILIQHGLIASIQDAHLFARLSGYGARLISIARPGYGASSPYPMKDIAEWGEIVSLLVDELKLPRFDVLGMSSGAPYSYAIGYILPDKARNIFIFSGIPALYDDGILAHWPHPVDRQAGLPELQKLARELFFTNLTAADLSRNDIQDSMRNDCFGLALDFKLRCVDWGFSLSDVKELVVMQHSRTDNLIPAQLTAALLPNCQLGIRDGEHFSEALLDEFFQTAMARYYEHGN